MEPRFVYSTNELFSATDKDVLPASQKCYVIYQFSCHCNSRLQNRCKQNIIKSIRSCSSSQIRRLSPCQCKSSTQPNIQSLASDSAIGFHLLLQCFSICGTRTTSGTARSSRWYASNFNVVPFFTKKSRSGVPKLVLQSNLMTKPPPNCRGDFFLVFNRIRGQNLICSCTPNAFGVTNWIKFAVVQEVVRFDNTRYLSGTMS